MIFAPEPHRGWLPWAWFSPVVCIFLVAFSSVPFDFGFEWIGLIDPEKTKEKDFLKEY